MLRLFGFLLVLLGSLALIGEFLSPFIDGTPSTISTTLFAATVLAIGLRVARDRPAETPRSRARAAGTDSSVQPQSGEPPLPSMALRIYRPELQDTPLKRIGYLLFIVGLPITIGSLMHFFHDFRPGQYGNPWRGIFLGWPNQISREIRHYEHRQVLLSGIGLMTVGWMLSYGYNRLLGKLVQWIRVGRR